MYNCFRSKYISTLILFSVVIGLAMRIFFLFRRDFWFDEAFTFFIAKLPLKQILPAVLTDNNPPLYYLLMHFVVRFSQSPVILRLPSLLFNVGSVYFLYKVVTRLINNKAGIHTVAFFCLSPLTIYLSTTARLHALGLFFIPFITWLFLDLIDRPTLPRKVLFIFVSLLGLYTQYYVALLFIPLSIWLVIKCSRKMQKSWFLIVTLLCGLFIPWVLAQKAHSPAICSCPPTHLSLPATLVSPILGGIGEITVRRYNELPIPTILFFGGASIFNLVLFWKGLKKNRFFGNLYITPLILVSAIGIWVPFFSPKGFSIFSPIFFALMAIGITQSRNSSKFAAICMLGLLAVNIIQATNPFFAGTSIYPIVEVIKDSTFPVVHVSAITYYPAKFYLPSHIQLLLTESPISKKTVRYIGGDQVQEMTEARLWLVDTYNWVDSEARNTRLARIYEDYQIVSEVSQPPVSIKLIQRK